MSGSRFTRSSPVTALGASLAVALTLAACGQDAGAPTTDKAEETARTTAGAQVATAGASTLWRDGVSSPLDIQVAHPNGVVLQLTSLQSRPTETVLGVRVINGRDREVQLNRFNNRDGYIVMDNGERIYLSPPTTNRDLTIQPGQTLEGELVFLGRLPPTESALLVLNENSTGDNQYSTTPGFRIALPVAGPAPAASGAAS